MMNTTESTKTPAQQFADDVNATCPLVRQPEESDPKWDLVSGNFKKTYYERSPYSTIDAYQRGFIVWNHVTGSQHPCGSWEEAQSLRGNIAARYKTINAGMRY